VFLSPKFI